MKRDEILSDIRGSQSIVIVDDLPDNLRLLTAILTESGYKVRPAPNGNRALATICKDPPDLILLDIMMPEMDGYEVCRQLKADQRTRDVPVIFLSALNEVFDKIKAFKAGGVDYIAKPFQVEEVLLRVNTHLMICAQQRALELQNQELIEQTALITEQKEKLALLATTDSLTGLSNRRDFLDKAQLEEKRFKRTNNSFALLILDVDHFKQVNDTHGHDTGDQVLVAIARTLEKTLRVNDLPARWGGEEFVCLLPETEAEGAVFVAEKIRAAIEDHKHQYNNVAISVTVTLGVHVYDGSDAIKECLSSADAALYEGKKRGRNQVVLADNFC